MQPCVTSRAARLSRAHSSAFMRGVALAALTTLTTIGAAHAETSRHKLKPPHAKANLPPAREPTAADYRRALDAVTALTTQVHTLSDQVNSLQGRLDQQASAQAATEAKAAEAAQVQENVTAAAIQSIPAQVATAVDAAKPKTDAIYYKGLKITPGGFLEASNQYRSRALGSDMFSPYNSIPFASTGTGHESEDRFSARQSRFNTLIQGDVSPDVQLAIFGEIDFLGAAQTANYNESNSFTPRLRNLYATIDMKDSGWHILAGQSWSLATLNSKGITPRNETPPPMIDAQFVPGFVWTRQPQLRIVKDFDKALWLAVSVENPQTTFTGTVPAGVLTSTANNTGLFGGAANGTAPATAGGGTAATPTTATSSFNHAPDVIVKAAYEAQVAGRALHLEVYGLGRTFTDRVNHTEDNVFAGGAGWGVGFAAIPGLLDLETSGLTGKGVGRYGTSQLPDVTFAPSGKIEPISETDWLAGGTLHATHTLDIYAFAGGEHEDRRTYSATYGYGSPLLNLSGCYTEGGSCSAATKFSQQETIGFWQKVYQGAFGRAQVGVQYSYTERKAFSGLDGMAPMASDNIVFTSLRYYPF